MKIIRIAVIAVLILAAVYYWPPARLRAMVLLGRSPDCPMARAVQSDDELQQQIKIKDELLKNSKKLETDPNGFELWDTPKGRWWIPKGSHFVLPFNLAEQSRKIYGTGDRFVHPGDIVLDCGANVGVFAREALDAGAKLVVAIEPAPENLECLRRNFKPEIAAGKLIVYPKGVWDKDDFLTLNVDPNNSAADSFVIQREGSQAMVKMPLTTIDKLAAELKLERVDFIKMDIEGAEVKALDGAHGVLAKYRPRMSLAVYHQADHPRSIPAAAARGWDGYKTECGPCEEEKEHFFIHPAIMYFFQ